jgi:hypothetical protein
MDLLGLFANQAAVALDLLLHTRRIERLLAGSGEELEAVAQLAERLDGLDGTRRAAGIRLLSELANVLGR